MEWPTHRDIGIEEQNRFSINKPQGIRFANSIGDYNLIHRNDDFARKKGLEGAIAPGMYLASFIHNLMQDIKNIQIRFRTPIYYNHSVVFSHQNNIFHVKNGDDKTVCRIEINSDFENIPKVSEFDYTYKTKINKIKMGDFLQSIEIRKNVLKLEKLPEMYLISFSGPALIEYGHNINIQNTGMQIFQSAQIHSPYDFGDLNIGLKKIDSEKNLSKINTYWMQNNKLIASGLATGLTL